MLTWMNERLSDGNVGMECGNGNVGIDGNVGVEMTCKAAALTCTFLQWRAGAHMDVIDPDVARGRLFKDAFDDHLPGN